MNNAIIQWLWASFNTENYDCFINIDFAIDNLQRIFYDNIENERDEALEGIPIFIQNDSFFIEDVVLCRRKTFPEGHGFGTKFRKSHGLTLILSGTMAYTYAGKEILAGKGDIILQRNGDSYQLRAVDGPVEFIVISYLCQPDELADRLAEAGKVFSGGHLARYSDIFERVEEEYRNPGLWKQPLLRGLVQQIVCMILREQSTRAEPEMTNIASAARSYMDDNACSAITVEDVAKAVGCSASYLRQIFKKNYGLPPVKYLNEVRIRRAKEMLAAGFFSQEEISDACGFRNVYYFGRVFKEITGVSPGKY